MSTRRCSAAWSPPSWTPPTPSKRSCSARARGDARPDLDVDLAVIEAEPFGPHRDRRAEIVRPMRALGGLGVARDVPVYSRDEVEYWCDSLNNVLARALREGRVLYERPQAGARVD